MGVSLSLVTGWSTRIWTQKELRMKAKRLGF